MAHEDQLRGLGTVTAIVEEEADGNIVNAGEGGSSSPKRSPPTNDQVLQNFRGTVNPVNNAPAGTGEEEDVDDHSNLNAGEGISSVLMRSQIQPPLSLNHSDAENELRRRLDYYRPLHLAILKGDWKAARRFFHGDPNAVTQIITFEHSRTALHVAALAGHSDFVIKLADLMPMEALEMRDYWGRMGIHYVAMGGNAEAAKALVTKNHRLTQMMDKEAGSAGVAGKTPLFMAAACASENGEMLRYLCAVTTDEQPGVPFTGPLAGPLMFLIAFSGYHDISLHLLRKYPNLATAENEFGYSMLQMLAMKFGESRSRLGFWGRWIYPFVSVDANYISTASTTMKSRTTKGIKKVRDTKLRHQCALQCVQIVNQQLLSRMNATQIFKYFDKLDFFETAAIFGVVEIISECLQRFPDLIWNGNIRRKLVDIAIEYRQEKVFSLVCEAIPRNKATSNNLISREWISIHRTTAHNILHLAAKLPRSYSLSVISGAALQLQSELQWFKEVEKLVDPITADTKCEGKKAREVFTAAHKDLTEKAEGWMKDTSNSCLLVASLIATVVFAAAFTVPGGNISDNNSKDNGIPVFLRTNRFTVFAIADALALFSSSTSILMFMSILTARYAEEDFLYSLPRKMIVGLGSLFVAIATMMVAFGAGLSIVLGERFKWITFPIVMLALFPVSMFVMLQLPLFLQMIRSTYGKKFPPPKIW